MNASPTSVCVCDVVVAAVAYVDVVEDVVVVV